MLAAVLSNIIAMMFRINSGIPEHRLGSGETCGMTLDNKVLSFWMFANVSFSTSQLCDLPPQTMRLILQRSWSSK